MPKRRRKNSFIPKDFWKGKQNKLEKACEINYYILELQDYLSPNANLTLEDEQVMFSLRCKMKQLKVNFLRNEKKKKILYKIMSKKRLIMNTSHGVKS